MARILIAEDDSSMRNFLAMALRRAGHDVDMYEDGLSAFNAITANIDAYDLLLSDIVMPGMDGIELSRKVTDIAPGIKIMFITGFAAIAAEKQSATVLAKPFHLRDLVDQVDRILAA